MDYGGVPKPGILDARYAGLSGGRRRRIELYLARRYFGYGWKKWDRLPWWYQRTLLEGLEEEGVLNGDGSTSRPSKYTEPQERFVDLSGAEPGEFAALGFREHFV